MSNAEKASVTAVSEAEIAPVEESGMAEAGDVSEKVAFDSLDGRRKAAIMAALCAPVSYTHLAPLLLLLLQTLRRQFLP